MVLEFITVLRYTFNMYNLGIYDFLLTFSTMLTSIVFFLVCYYFVTKASIFLDNQSRTVFLLNAFGIVCLLIFVAIFIAQIVQYVGYDYSKLICKTASFIVPSLVSVVISAIFIYTSSIISRNVHFKIH